MLHAVCRLCVMETGEKNMSLCLMRLLWDLRPWCQIATHISFMWPSHDSALGSYTIFYFSLFWPISLQLVLITAP